jgi:hypothetical protein
MILTHTKRKSEKDPNLPDFEVFFGQISTTSSRK